MRKLLNILLCLLAAFGAEAQGLSSLNHANPGVVVLTTSDANALYSISHNDSREYQLAMWNGVSWKNFGQIPNLPAHGSNPDGEFALRDAKVFKGELFITGEYYINSSGAQTNLVFKWDGSGWTDISNSAIQESQRIAKLEVLNGKLILLGVFESQETNLLEWNGGNTWNTKHDWLTLNRTKDYITDATVYKNVLYVSGRFTRKVGIEPFYTAVLTTQGWSSVTHPPFLFGSGHFSNSDEGLSLFGTPNAENDHFKRFNGSGWDDISQGMSNILVQEIWDIASIDGSIYASGVFVNELNQLKVNIIRFDGTNWKTIDFNFTNQPVYLYSWNKELYVYGDYEYSGVKNIGKLSSGKAIISGYVFVDENTNCKMDTGEPGVNQFVVRLNPGEHIFWTDKDGYFSIPVEQGKFTIDLPELVRFNNDCNNSLSVDVTNDGNYKTEGFGLTFKKGVTDLKVKSGFFNGFKLITDSWNKGYFEIINTGNTIIRDARFEITTKPIWAGLNFEPSYDFIDDDRYIWIIKNLGVGESLKISISALLEQGVDPNDLLLTYHASTVDPSGDAAAWDNSGTLTFDEVESLEPIYKQCGNGRFFYDNKPLSYYIRFANVGKSTVNDIVVRDTIDEDVYISKRGIEFYTSHDANFSSESIIYKGSYYYVFNWAFDNIDLIDSSSGDDFVGFINLNLNLREGRHPSGTMVCNEAEVFFDQQEPYATNEVCTEARNISTPIPPLQSGLTFFPNPLDEALVIQTDRERDVKIEVYSTDGRLIYVEDAKLREDFNHTIQTATWSSGIYLLRFNGSDCYKLIVQ